MFSSFDSEISKQQGLSFDIATRMVDSKLGKRSFEKLILKDEDGMYNNFALLLSDQCPWSYTICSRHYGIVAVTSGSVLKQLSDVMSILDTMNPRVKMKGRTGYIRKFPRASVQEGVINAAIHSDMGGWASALVLIGDDSMEIITNGAILLDVAVGTYDIAPRNRLLAELLKDMGMVTLKYRGHRTMRYAYNRTGFVPSLKTMGSTSRLVLPSVEGHRKEKEFVSRTI